MKAARVDTKRRSAATESSGPESRRTVRRPKNSGSKTLAFARRRFIGGIPLKRPGESRLRCPCGAGKRKIGWRSTILVLRDYRFSYNRGQLPLAHKQRRVASNERSEEHTSELQSLMRISYAVFCLKKKNNTK